MTHDAVAVVDFGGQDAHLIATKVRPVPSERAMTAAPARLPDALLADLRTAILALPGIGGLCLDITSKPPGTIEWE